MRIKACDYFTPQYSREDREFELMIGDSIVDNVNAAWISEDGCRAKAIIGIGVLVRSPSGEADCVGLVEEMKSDATMLEPVELIAPKGFYFWFLVTTGEDEDALSIRGRAPLPVRTETGTDDESS